MPGKGWNRRRRTRRCEEGLRDGGGAQAQSDRVGLDRREGSHADEYVVGNHRARGEPDGKLAAASGKNATPLVWSVAGGKVIAALEGHDKVTSDRLLARRSEHRHGRPAVRPRVDAPARDTKRLVTEANVHFRVARRRSSNPERALRGHPSALDGVSFHRALPSRALARFRHDGESRSRCRRRRRTSATRVASSRAPPAEAGTFAARVSSPRARTAVPLANRHGRRGVISRRAHDRRRARSS